MTPTTTNISEHLMLDGPIPFAATVLLGLVVVVVSAWALWRERGILGNRQSCVFWILRSVAIGTVFWMLLSPVTQRVEVSNTRRSLVFIQDATGSMDTVDPLGTSEDYRWAISQQSREIGLSHADQAIAAMQLAKQHLTTFIEDLKNHKPESETTKKLIQSQQAIESVREHISNLQNANTNAVVKNFAKEQVEFLNETEFQSFQSLVKTLEKGRTPTERGWQESLADLEYRMQQSIRSLRELAHQIAVDERNNFAKQQSEQLIKVSKQTRKDRVANYLNQIDASTLNQIREEADVHIASFAQDVDWASGTLKSSQAKNETVGYTSGGTNLSTLLAQLQRQQQEQSIAATFIFTDAAHNVDDGEVPQNVASSLSGAPVYVVPIGNRQYVRDVILQSVSAPTVAMRNDDIVIEANLEAHDCAGETCHLELLQDGEVIDFREVSFDSEFATRAIRFEQKVPEIGTQKFQIAISPLNGEASEENNYDEVEVNITRSDIKILLADELPRWEFRYLAQLFRRDPKVECDELLFRPRMIATGRRTDSKTLPTTVDDWDQYDVVLLGDLPPEHFPIASQESLKKYLHERSGTLILIAGHLAMPQAYSDHPLKEMLPVQKVQDAGNSQSYAFQVTADGLSHHALMIAETEAATRTAWDFINRYAPLHAVSEWRRPLPSAETLIAAVDRNSVENGETNSESAFLCWQPIGRGRIVYLSGPETFRLRFLRGDRLHFRFWGQLLRWAIASDLSTGTEFVRLRTNKSRYQTNEIIRASVQLSDSEGNAVEAEDLSLNLSSGDDLQTVPLTANPNVPGEYQAEINSLTSGVYRIEPVGDAIDQLQDEILEPPVASITVQANLPREMVDTRCDMALAQQIADLTGGQVLPPTAITEILSLIDLEPILEEKIERTPLWLQWKYLWIVFGCLQLEWVIRKWRGLS